MTGQTYLVEDSELVAPAGSAGRFGGRWRLIGAGLSNVWRYGDLQLPAASGRLLLRGQNGTGKTTALEALWPFLLDLDRAKLRAGQSRTTTLASLMREGQTERKRIGYVWLTLSGPADEGVWSWGARLVFSNGSSPTVKVEPFAVPGAPLIDVPLTGPGRSTISTPEAFRELIEGAGGTVFADEDEYQTALANRVFETAQSDLVVLADRVRKVRNPSLLAATSADDAARSLREALPGVANDVIEATGQALASTEETRAAFQRDVDAAAILGELAGVWAGHAAEVAGRTADAAAVAQTELVKARRTRDTRETDHRNAVLAAESAQADLNQAEEELLEAQAQIEAIVKSPAYAAIGRLADLRSTAEARDAEARAKIGALEQHVNLLRRGVDALTEDVANLAETVAAAGSAVADLDREVSTGLPVVYISTRPHSIVTVGERAYDPGPTAQLSPPEGALADVARDWLVRARNREDRAAAAELMIREHNRVITAEQDAARKAQRADDDDLAADRAAQSRDRMTERVGEQVRQYVGELGRWAAANRDLTSTSDSDPLDADALNDVAAEGPAVLLDSALGWSLFAQRNAEAAAARFSQEARNRADQAADLRNQAQDARREAEALRSGRVIPPPRPTWAGPVANEAFANAVDWLDDTAPDVRSLIESALAESGVLGATLTDQGVHTDAWTLSTTGPVATPNLGELIRVDPDQPRAEVAQAVLERIALAASASHAPGDSAAVIGLDATFRLGVVVGRAPGSEDPAAALPSQYVGRSQRRAAALAEAARLEDAADQLDGQAARHEADAAGLRLAADQVRERARRFPTTAALATAERERATAAHTADEARARAEASAAIAVEAGDHARALARAWRNQVSAMGLPVDPDALATARQQAAAAASGLKTAAQVVSREHGRLVRLHQRVAAMVEDRAALVGLHTVATTAHTAARRARLEYDRLEAEHGRDAAELAGRLSGAERAAIRAREDVATARILREDAVKFELRAEVEAANAAGVASALAPTADAALASLHSLVRVQDVADALLGEAAPAEGVALISQIRDAIRDLTFWGKRKVADTYEAAKAQLAGVWAVDRTDGYGDYLDTYQCTYDGVQLTLAAAARRARDLAARADRALHEAEEAALRDFIIDQLPAAIGTAWQQQLDWIVDVNQKMSAASASSGVGVRVSTRLRDDLTVTQKTVYRLACRKSAATRSPDDDRDLAEALKSLLAVATGDTITDRVREAVDIREWVRVDYFIHRPGEEPTRWTARQTGLSGGERRLVILAPMLASIAALYDNFPATALRLAALDEVPAEVDERGREGLARYIAELDLDVICTSYLWDGAPGAWDGVDAHDLEASDGIVVAFPMLIRGLDALPDDSSSVR